MSMFFLPGGTGTTFQFEPPKQSKPVKRQFKLPTFEHTTNPLMEGYTPGQLQEPGAGRPFTVEPVQQDIPAPTEKTPQKRETWLSRLIRPDSDELAAEQNGRRWNWQLENRFMLPGSKYSEQVMAGADRENRLLGTTLKVQSGIASAREHANAKASWDKFVSDIYNGNWDNAGKTYEEAQQFEKDFKQWYAAQGWDPSDLRPIGTSVGKLNNATRKAMTDMASDLSDTEQYMTDIAQWAKDGSWRDPIKSAMIKDYLDKVSQKLSATLGGDSKSMADAEKVRIQILYLPEDSMKQVQQELRNYREWLSKVQAYGSAKGWSQDVLGRINQAKSSLGAALNTGDQGNISTLAGQAASYLGSALGGMEKNSELAIDVNAVLGAGVKQHEEYMRNMVLAADVDPARVFLLAKQLHDLTRNRYDNEARRSNRPNDLWKPKEIESPDMQMLHKVVRPSPFLEPNRYFAPSVAKQKPESPRPNPQSTGEVKAVKGGFKI